MGIARTSVVCVGLAILTAGCEVRYGHPHAVVYAQPEPVVVEPEQPVVVDPGVVAIDVEPAPDDRVYVYDPGYPPGTYLYNGFYYYGGYRYPHDVFVNRYVVENVRQHRFADVEENRRAGVKIEQQHRADFAVNHGRRPAAKQPARQPAMYKQPQNSKEHKPGEDEQR